MRLAILGNSHAACLLMALGETPDAVGPDLSCTVYAAAGRHMEDLSLEGDQLVPGTENLRTRLEQTSGGEARIDLKRFDGFLLVGMQYRVRPIPLSYSRAVASAALGGRLKGSIAWRLTKRIRSRSDRPILMLHEPLPGRSDTDGPGAFYSYDEELAMLAPLAAKRDLTLVRQPLETRVGDVFTRPEFTQGSRGLMEGVAHSETDMHHMNADFGRLVLSYMAELVP